MQINKIIICITEYGNWYGMYVNNELYHDGHDIPVWVWGSVVSKYNMFGRVEIYEVSMKSIEKLGDRFPDNFKDIPKEFLEC